MDATVFNLLWGLLFCIVNFILVLVFYYFFGKVGMFVWICIATIIANIQVTKSIDLFGYAATLGNVFYGSIFLATDILSEKYGKKEATRSVFLGFMTNLVVIISMQMALVFKVHSSDFAQESLATIFGLIPRICLGSLLAYLVSQFLDIVLFAKIKKKTEGKYVWLRNNVATMISQLFDTLIFVSVSFIGVYKFVPDIVSIFVSTYVLKFVVAILDTPFLYVARKLKGGLFFRLKGSKENDIDSTLY